LPEPDHAYLGHFLREQRRAGKHLVGARTPLIHVTVVSQCCSSAIVAGPNPTPSMHPTLCATSTHTHVRAQKSSITCTRDTQHTVTCKATVQCYFIDNTVMSIGCTLFFGTSKNTGCYRVSGTRSFAIEDGTGSSVWFVLSIAMRHRGLVRHPKHGDRTKKRSKGNAALS